MTRTAAIGNFLLFTRTGHTVAFLAGAALWFVTAPVLVPITIAAVALDRRAARRSGR
jgi:hypothetical protein